MEKFLQRWEVHKINGDERRQTNLEEKMGELPGKDQRAQNDLNDSFWEDIRKYTIHHCKTIR